MMQFAKDGFLYLPEILTKAACEAIADRITLNSDKLAGSRTLLSEPWCENLANHLHNSLSTFISSHFIPIQCTFFQKSLIHNWLVPIHQDLSIPVKEKIEHPDLKVWSEKEGSLYVQPPLEFLQQLVAVRLHLDDCGANDGALKVVPGSHLLGKINGEEALKLRQENPEVICIANSGDVIIMRPLLLHSSSKSSGNNLRRVLHFLFAPSKLPLGLQAIANVQN
jgi:hypothetical protein